MGRVISTPAYAERVHEALVRLGLSEEEAARRIDDYRARVDYSYEVGASARTVARDLKDPRPANW